MNMPEAQGVIADHLPLLNEAVAQLVTRRDIHKLIDSLKKQLPHGRRVLPYVRI